MLPCVQDESSDLQRELGPGKRKPCFSHSAFCSIQILTCPLVIEHLQPHPSPLEPVDALSTSSKVSYFMTSQEDPLFYLAITTVGPLPEEQAAFRRAEVGLVHPESSS